jgi:carbon monoxide dehydrogenase subunit G
VRIQNEFEVKAPIDRVWAYLLDVQKIAPCAPGAELTEVIDDRTWKGKVNVKVGPVAMSFAGTVLIQERDDQAHVVVLKADGREQRGKGAASAVVQSRLETVEGGTKVSIDTDLTISGAVAQYGRGMVGDISQRLTREFADCLQGRIAGEEPVPQAAPPAAAGPVAEAGGPPVKGIRLGVWALWRAMARFFKRLFGRRGG